MSVTRDVLQRLASIEKAIGMLDDHLHSIMRNQRTMSAALDRMTAAVDANSAATDSLSDEVAVAVDWIKNHADANTDPAIIQLAMRLEEKNAKALAAKDALDAAVGGVSASGGSPNS